MNFVLEKEALMKAAQEAFPNKYIEVDNIDFYVPDVKEGILEIEGIEEPFHVSTNYAYEDRIVIGNKTRYKVELSLIYVKEDRYEVIYDSYGKSYIAYETDKIHFALYEDFYEELRPYIIRCESSQ